MLGGRVADLLESTLGFNWWLNDAYCLLPLCVATAMGRILKKHMEEDH